MSNLTCFRLSFDTMLVVLTSAMALESLVIFGLLFRATVLVKRGQYDKSGVLVFPIYFWSMLAMSGAAFFRSFVLAFVAKDTKLWQLLQFVVAGALARARCVCVALAGWLEHFAVVRCATRSTKTLGMRFSETACV